MRSEIDKEYEGAASDPDEDRMLIIGDALLWLLEEFPEYTLSKDVVEFLDLYLQDPRERALFNLSPRLDYDDKLLPWKTPRDPE